MSEETHSVHWRRTVDHGEYDPARADAVEQIRERLNQPKPERTAQWALPAPGLAKVPATGPYQVFLGGGLLAERPTLAEAARVALSFTDATVRRGGREWRRGELAGLGKIPD